ncbi:putative phage abortive infection protein [Pseudaquidulcibacter saccharophilus]|uniref:putative phage abortive infection protein n=1 Tax=Pseudaquidulcibacter saccharophilus TaxID=2831900 RepID=UPI001EFF4D0B|nr:putative phage abortive infection protein [Pseudaquidulcibacter saccharophilus]
MKYIIKKSFDNLKFIFFMILVFFLIYFIIYENWKFGLYIADNPKFREIFGQFGDIFGFSNALFSGLAFLFLVAGFYLQFLEIKNARNSYLEQEYESRFFNLINLLNSIVNDFDIKKRKTHEQIHRGRDVFVFYYDKLEMRLKNIDFTDTNKNFNAEFNKEYKCFITKQIIPENNKEARVNGDNGFELLHYFRTIYIILKFIEESNLNKNVKSFYVRVLRSQTSEYQLRMIIYNALSNHSYDKKGGMALKKLIEQTTFLDNLIDSEFKDKIKNKFLETAFN